MKKQETYGMLLQKSVSIEGKTYICGRIIDDEKSTPVVLPFEEVDGMALQFGDSVIVKKVNQEINGYTIVSAL